MLTKSKITKIMEPGLRKMFYAMWKEHGMREIYFGHENNGEVPVLVLANGKKFIERFPMDEWDKWKAYELTTRK